MRKAIIFSSSRQCRGFSKLRGSTDGVNYGDHRQHFDNLISNFQLKSPLEIESLSNEGIELHSVIKKYYDGSIRKALQILYPELKLTGINDKNPSGHWKDFRNHRIFFDKLAKELNIKNKEDWLDVTFERIAEKGGGPLMQLYYGKSVFNALSNIYPEYNWDGTQFENLPRNYWNNLSNQRKFFDKLTKEFGIQNMKEWTKITKAKVEEKGGLSILKSYYGFSLIKALKAIYPEYSWEREEFEHLSIYPPNHFQSLENCKIFLDEIATERGLVSESDWSQVSLILIKKKGGKSLLKLYDNSLSKILRKVYPERDWSLLEESSFNFVSKPHQTILNYLKQWIPSMEISTNFRHPDLIHPSSKQNIELDIWIPELKLGFEYHGVQHYQEQFPDFERQRTRDEERRKQCKDNGITLIEVPYWWDLTPEKLLSTINSVKPEILDRFNVDPSIDYKNTEPIPDNKSMKDSGIYRYLRSDLILPDFLMHGKDWSPSMDPAGWWMTVKYDGLRLLWDGEEFFTRKGNKVSSPAFFKSQLPKIQLDGELWFGNLTHQVSKTCIKDENDVNWKKAIFQVFDSPTKDGLLEDRYQYLKQVLKSSPNIQLINMSKCQGKEDLMNNLEEIIKNGGEGVILREPQSTYLFGRSDSVLKVKPMYTEKVVVVDHERRLEQGKYTRLVLKNKYGNTFSLLQKVSQMEFPSISQNSVISIRFSGFTPTGLPRYPHIKELVENVKWEEITPYFLSKNQEMGERDNCLTCNHKFDKVELRVSVKGMYWPSRTPGHSPTYQLISFCPKPACVTSIPSKLEYDLVPFTKFIGVSDKFADNFSPKEKKYFEELEEKEIKVKFLPEEAIDSKYFFFENKGY